MTSIPKIAPLVVKPRATDFFEGDGAVEYG